MNEEILEQLARYNKGFLDARIDAIGAYKLGKSYEYDENKLKGITDIWYCYGYRDGYMYYYGLIKNGTESYMSEDTNKLMKKSFSNRVINMI